MEWKSANCEKRFNVQSIKNFGFSVVVGISPLFAAPYIIPTVVHIINPTDNSGKEWQLLTDAEIRVGIANVNKQFKGDYAKNISSTILSEHQALIGNTEIEFRLATLDPTGNTTTGITREWNDTWSRNAESNIDAIKNKLNWNRAKYFNVYLFYGYNSWWQSGMTYMPSEVASTTNAIKDGAMITYEIWPSTLPLTYPQWTTGFDGTLAHEFGHYLGLSHTWGNSNNAGTGCNDPLVVTGDGVSDTPKHYTRLDNVTAGTRVNECDGALTMIDNFMTYSKHQCFFTPGQAAKIQTVLQSSVASRNNLWTPANLLATGTSGNVGVILKKGSEQKLILSVQSLSEPFRFSVIGKRIPKSIKVTQILIPPIKSEE